MKHHIPNTITILNLLSGCIGIVFAFSGDLEYAAYMIWIAAIFDFFDGAAARLLKVKSATGKELDSLADVVSFGVLPSAIMFILIEERSSFAVLPYLAFSIAIFSAIRLAKFNIDPNQEDSFSGLPTPAAAFFISSIPFIITQHGGTFTKFLNAEALLAICLMLSFLLISNIKLFSLKFKNVKWQNNAIRYIFVLLSVILIIIWKVAAIPLIIITYLALSLIAKFPSLTK